MKFVFIDECYSKVGNKPYTAAIASVWKDTSLAGFRSSFIKSIATAINCEPSRINPFPTIHAAEMAKEYRDGIKLLCFETIANLCKQFGVEFYYLGYFDHVPLLITPPDILTLAVTALCDSLTTSANDEEMVFVYELNLSKHSVISLSYNDWHTHYLREAIGENNLSIRNSGNVIGRYYCDKKNYHMATTDTASYVRNLKVRAEEGQINTNFKTEILSRAGHLTELFKWDEIIQINAFPYDKRTGSGPSRYMFPVTPSDDVDLSEQFEEFLEKLKDYWETNPAGKQASPRVGSHQG
jgi:hypothetical protein